jgi:ADP-ribosylglycohydrolase
MACQQSAAMVALLVAALLRGESDPLAFAMIHAGSLTPEVAEALKPVPLESLESRRLDGPDMGSTLLALKVAVSVLQDGMPFTNALPWVIRQGGDTDTNGAIVGALLGTRDGIGAIPQEWWECLAQPDSILQAAGKLLDRSGVVPGSFRGPR